MLTPIPSNEVSGRAFTSERIRRTSSFTATAGSEGVGMESNGVNRPFTSPIPIVVREGRMSTQITTR